MKYLFFLSAGFLLLVKLPSFFTLFVFAAAAVISVLRGRLYAEVLVACGLCAEWFGINHASLIQVPAAVYIGITRGWKGLAGLFFLSVLLSYPVNSGVLTALVSSGSAALALFLTEKISRQKHELEAELERIKLKASAIEWSGTTEEDTAAGRLRVSQRVEADVRKFLELIADGQVEFSFMHEVQGKENGYLKEAVCLYERPAGFVLAKKDTVDHAFLRRIREAVEILIRDAHEIARLRRNYLYFKLLQEELSSFRTLSRDEILKHLEKAVYRMIPDAKGMVIDAGGCLLRGDRRLLKRVHEIAKRATEPVYLEDEEILFVPLSGKGHFAAIHGKMDRFQARIAEILLEHAGVMLENAELFQRMETLALYDGLTGLINRRAFMDALECEINRHRRKNLQMGILLIDIDFFKKVNDTYGHQMGDAVLKETASVIRSSVREHDICGRFGGEEFAVILVEVSEDGLNRSAERIRVCVEENVVKADKAEIRVTVSIGGSLLRSSDTAESLIERADVCLYQAKRGGRNRAVIDLPLSSSAVSP